ncbi:MAG: ATP-dependent DNA ligase, partial [Rhodothermales bacterium]|nr:ATP-dependent DNA ligase [Rhodothermales bacterium]
MHEFSVLYRRLDETSKRSEKTAALSEYFAQASAADAAWAVYFLVGRRPKRLVKSARLREWAAVQAGIGEWLFEDCHQAVGDLAETMARILPAPLEVKQRPLHEWVERYLLPLRELPEDAQRSKVLAAWKSMEADARFVWNKILTTGLRAGVSTATVIRGLSAAFGLERSVLAHRLEGDWHPTAEFFERLVAPDTSDTEASRPYPFCGVNPLEAAPSALGAPEGWMVEWKWDGIRAQIIRRGGKVFIWTRDGELVTDRFPETAESAMMLPDGTVLDGELLAWGPEGVLPFDTLQRRMGRKTLGPKALRETPICCIVFDLMEHKARNMRDEPLRDRRRILAKLLSDMPGSAAMCLSKT